jgi:hypothetical protein
MDYLLALVGLGVIVWALSALFSPPKKHKTFSLKDQRDAMHRALGGNRPPDASDVEPLDPKERER